MMLLALYLIFVIFILLIVGYLVLKLPIPSPYLVIGLLMLVIVSPVLVTYFYTTYIAPLPEVVVPSLTWLTTEEADVRLSLSGLKGRIAEYSYERTVPAGKIISQNPEPGRRVKVGRIINLKVSMGTRKTVVPNLVGRPFSQVEIVLSEAGLKVGRKIEEYSEQYQTGVVVRQAPFPEVEVNIGSYVDVTIAQNPKFGIVKVPDLSGKTLEEASDILNKLKLNANIIYHETNLFPQGTVMSQTPLPGEEIEMGREVKLVISKPKE